MTLLLEILSISPIISDGEIYESLPLYEDKGNSEESELDINVFELRNSSDDDIDKSESIINIEIDDDVSELSTPTVTNPLKQLWNNTLDSRFKKINNQSVETNFKVKNNTTPKSKSWRPSKVKSIKKVNNLPFVSQKEIKKIMKEIEMNSLEPNSTSIYSYNKMGSIKKVFLNNNDRIFQRNQLQK